MKRFHPIPCLLLISGSFLMHPAIAVSLSGKASDDSVCDLSPLTSYRLGTKTFVEAGTLHSDEIYTRLALRFVTRRCRNDQVLILDSEDGGAFDARYFREVANRLCRVGDIARVPNTTNEYPNGFQLKCRINKMQEATAWLSSAERAKPTESMIVEGAPRHSQAPNPSRKSDRTECSNITMGTIFFGGSGCK
jgi:hypothetical protein